MPSNWLTIDTNFPTFTGEESAEQQIRALHNYMFQLREGLQYTLQNLTAENFNATALQNLTDTQKSEVTALLKQVYGTLSQLSNEIDNLNGRISGAENLAGKVTAIEDKTSLLEDVVESLGGWMTETDLTTEDLSKRTEALEDTVIGPGGLTERTEAAEIELQKISGAVQVAEDGSTAVGVESKALYLVGEIYINGVLYGQGGTT